MKWKLLKGANGSKRNNLRAYEDIFLSRHAEKKPQEIIEAEVQKKLKVVSQIADEGIDEKNRLKAAISWLRFSRQVSEVHKIEVEGSLTLEARLNEALEGEEDKDTTP